MGYTSIIGLPQIFKMTWLVSTTLALLLIGVNQANGSYWVNTTSNTVPFSCQNFSQRLCLQKPDDVPSGWWGGEVTSHYKNSSFDKRLRFSLYLDQIEYRYSFVVGFRAPLNMTQNGNVGDFMCFSVSVCLNEKWECVGNKVFLGLYLNGPCSGLNSWWEPQSIQSNGNGGCFGNQTLYNPPITEVNIMVGMDEIADVGLPCSCPSGVIDETMICETSALSSWPFAFTSLAPTSQSPTSMAPTTLAPITANPFSDSPSVHSSTSSPSDSTAAGFSNDILLATSLTLAVLVCLVLVISFRKLFRTLLKHRQPKESLQVEMIDGTVHSPQTPSNASKQQTAASVAPRDVETDARQVVYEYFAFLSYAQRDIRLEAQIVKDFFSEREPLFRIFLDRDEVLDLANLPSKVSSSLIVVVLLTPSYLRRPFCLVELATAYRDKKRIIVINIPETTTGATFAHDTINSAIGVSEEEQIVYIRGLIDRSGWQILKNAGYDEIDVLSELSSGSLITLLFPLIPCTLPEVVKLLIWKTFMINVMTGTHIFADVRIVHQDMTASATVKDPYADLEAVYKQKMAHYKEAFELETAGVQPLVFDIFGNYAKGTFEFLASLVRQISKNDDVNFQKLWMELRNRIAAALARGEAALVEYYRYKNGDGARRHYEHDPNLARQSQSEPRDAPAGGEEQSSDAANGTAGTGGARRGHGHTGGAEESEDSTRGVG